MTGRDTPTDAVEFVKGHGTENDFVLLADAQDLLRPSPNRCVRCATAGPASAPTA